MATLKVLKQMLVLSGVVQKLGLGLVEKKNEL